MCLGSLFWYCLLCICSILELEPIGLHWVHDSQKTGRIHHRTPVARAHELSIDKSSTRNGKTNRNLSQVGRFLSIMNFLWSIASSPAWSNPAEFFYHFSCLDRCRQPLSSTKIPGNRHNNCNQHHKWQLQMAINHPQRGRWFIAPLGFSQSGPAVRGTSVMPPWMSNVKSEKSKVSARNFTFSAPEFPHIFGRRPWEKWGTSWHFNGDFMGDFSRLTLTLWPCEVKVERKVLCQPPTDGVVMLGGIPSCEKTSLIHPCIPWTHPSDQRGFSTARLPHENHGQAILQTLLDAHEFDQIVHLGIWISAAAPIR